MNAARMPFREDESGWKRRIVPPASVMLASLLPLLPIVATVPVLPPLGLMVLIAWRLRRGDALPIWAAAPLGLFDDLASGQPVGSAMCIWALVLLAVDIIDQRLVWRSFRHDWTIAAGGIAGWLIAGRLVATPFGAHVDTVLLIQILLSVLLYPLAARLVARLDRTAPA